MATTAFDKCGYDAGFSNGNWVFSSELVDSWGDKLCWYVSINEDGTFSAVNDDVHFNERNKYDLYNFHTIREAVQWCKIKDLEYLLAKAQEQIETLGATAGSGEALAAKESPDVGNVRSS